MSAVSWAAIHSLPNPATQVQSHTMWDVWHWARLSACCQLSVNRSNTKLRNRVVETAGATPEHSVHFNKFIVERLKKKLLSKDVGRGQHSHTARAQHSYTYSYGTTLAYIQLQLSTHIHVASLNTHIHTAAAQNSHTCS
jgi:hypothetical protein